MWFLGISIPKRMGLLCFLCLFQFQYLYTIFLPFYLMLYLCSAAADGFVFSRANLFFLSLTWLLPFFYLL